MSARTQVPTGSPGNKRAKIVETERQTKLFRTNRSIAVRLPPDFGSAGDSVRIVRDGERLVIEPVEKNNDVAKLLRQWAKEPRLSDDDMLPSDINKSLLPARDIEL